MIFGNERTSIDMDHHTIDLLYTTLTMSNSRHFIKYLNQIQKMRSAKKRENVF